jgi:hypothetical protein
VRAADDSSPQYYKTILLASLYDEPGYISLRERTVAYFCYPSNVFSGPAGAGTSAGPNLRQRHLFLRLVVVRASELGHRRQPLNLMKYIIFVQPTLDSLRYLPVF